MVMWKFESSQVSQAVYCSEKMSTIRVEKARQWRAFANYAHQSPGSSFRRSRSQIADSLRRMFEKLPFFGDCGRRPGSIYTAWPVKRLYRRFESLSLRQMALGRVFSRRTRWQLSPVTVAISRLSFGLPIGGAGLLFSERPVSLRSSGLHRFGTVLQTS